MELQKFVTGKHHSMPEIRNRIGCQVIQPVKWFDSYKDIKRINRVQIYEDRGMGFSEENSYFVPEAYVGEQEVEFTLNVDGDVQVLRIDPSQDCCVVRIEELVFNGKAVPLTNKNIFYTNGKVLKPVTGAVFPTQDPNIHIKVAELDRQTANVLYARMQVARLPLQVAQDMAASVKKLL